MHNISFICARVLHFATTYDAGKSEINICKSDTWLRKEDTKKLEQTPTLGSVSQFSTEEYASLVDYIV